MGAVTAPTVRAFFGDGSGFSSAKQAASYVSITPSNWSSGTVTQPSRAITKEGPPQRTDTPIISQATASLPALHFR
jgi:transposase